MALLNSLSFPRLFLVFSIAIFEFGIAEAQYFEKVYGREQSTKAVSFTVDAAHNIIILGDAVDSVTHRTGYYLLKADAFGKILWEKKIIDRDDAYSYSISSLSEDRIVILGTHTGDAYPVVAEIILLDSAGNYINSSIYPPFNGWGTAGIGLTSSTDTAVTLILYNDGFISNNYYSIFSLNSDLTTKWSDFISHDGSYTNGHGLSSLPGKEIYTLSYYDNYFYSVNLLTRVTSVKKHDQNGNVLLDSLYEFNCITTSITETNDGGAIISGYQDSTISKDLVLIRIDNTGNVLWQKQFGSILEEESNTVIETFDKGFILLSTIIDAVIPGQHDILLTKTDANGDSLWSRTFGGTLDERSLNIVEDSTDLVILGTTTSFEDDHIYLIRADSSGIVQSPFSIFSGNRYYCENDTVPLFLNPPPSPDMHIMWSNGDTLNPALVSTSGNYSAVVSDTSGNVYNTSLVPVYFSELPNADIGNDTMSICSGALLVNSSSELTNFYQWFLDGQLLTSENTQSIQPATIGTYELIVTNYCAVDSDIVFIDSLYDNPLEPIITSPPVNFICEGDSLRLSFDYKVDETYQWYSTDYIVTNIIHGATDSVYYALESNSFFVKAINSNGCSIESDAKTVSYDLDKEFISINGPLEFCEGGEIELSVSSGSNYNWSQGDTTQFITVDTIGEYFCHFINQNGCPKNSDTVSITVHSNPEIYLGNDTVLCDSTTIILDVGSGFTNYYWNDASTEQSLFAFANGPLPDTSQYFVFVTDTNGCIAGDTLQIIFDICTEIYELSNRSLSVFPNPASRGEPFSFTVLNSDFYSLVIKDILGVEIIRKDFYGHTSINEDDNLISGVYLYNVIKDEKVVFAGKIIVK